VQKELKPFPWEQIKVMGAELTNWIITAVLPKPDAMLLDQVKSAVEATGPGRLDWQLLGADQAIEAQWQGVSNPTAVKGAIQTALADLPVDWAWQPYTVDRIKRLIVSDMDSTLIQGECIDELAEVAGLKPHIAAITAQAMRGELDFESALTHRVGLLQGLPVSAIDAVLATMQAMPGAATALATLNAKGSYCMLVSGGFTPFSARVATALGMDEQRANTLAFSPDGLSLTGQVVPPIVGARAKVEALESVAKQLGIPLSQTLAIGDGANDLPMIQRAGMGVAYHAKPAVAAGSPYAVRVGDWTTVLYFQGIPRHEWVMRPDTVVF
jgi:phosphoserine phosphatase